MREIKFRYRSTRRGPVYWHGYCIETYIFTLDQTEKIDAKFERMYKI